MHADEFLPPLPQLPYLLKIAGYFPANCHDWKKGVQSINGFNSSTVKVIVVTSCTLGLGNGYSLQSGTYFCALADSSDIYSLSNLRKPSAHVWWHTRLCIAVQCPLLCPCRLKANCPLQLHCGWHPAHGSQGRCIHCQFWVRCGSLM